MEREAISVPSFDSPAHKADFLAEAYANKVPMPWMNGGMGVDFSNDSLVKAVMKERGIGTLAGSAIGAQDYYRDRPAEPGGFDERVERYHAANETAMTRSIESVRDEQPDGILAVNIMAAMSDFRRMVDTVGKSEQVDLICVGAGLPRELAKQMEQYPHMHYAPIVSSARAAKAMLKAGIRGGRLPAAFYVELPQFAGGHLGAKDAADALDTEKFAPEKLLDEIRAVFKEDGIREALEQAGRPDIPLILAGGIAYGEDISHAYSRGYDGVSLGTRLLLTEESGMPDSTISDFYLNGGIQTETGMASPAGLPSRYLKVSPVTDETATSIRQQCISCIGSSHCQFQKPGGERDHYCIAKRLTAAGRGEPGSMLFTGSCRDQILSDPLYNQGGTIHIPNVRETMGFVFASKEAA